LPQEECATVRHIGDYIAGMTDRFAIDRYAEIFGRDAVPAALAHA
ncbi:MAG: deoxyguanosinetriphosphate triphosphohydrolase, partial [Sphingopyxis sp.]